MKLLTFHHKSIYFGCLSASCGSFTFFFKAGCLELLGQANLTHKRFELITLHLLAPSKLSQLPETTHTVIS